MNEERRPVFLVRPQERASYNAPHMPIAERACLALLLVYLFWLPLPFGSVIDEARLPLVVTPLLLCVAAALLAARDPATSFGMAYRTWSIGGALLVVIAALQLIPLSPSLLGALSPESLTIWHLGARVASIAGVPAPHAVPVTVDPAATRDELFRMLALLATFQAAALLVRDHVSRVALACALSAAAIFETLYGVREAALRRYAIWGWVNRLIYDRVTGTFVNPNHFGHYVAIVLPLALFLAALAWHQSGPDTMPFRRRLVLLLEHRFFVFASGALAALGCVAAVLVSQSRGALLAAAAGFGLVGARVLAARNTRAGVLVRIIAASAAGVLLLTAVILWLGSERTVLRRLAPTEAETVTLVGRRIGITAALGVWRDFPILGSGAGTFERVVSMHQSEDLGKMYHHAHDDYVEIGATMGTAGFVVAMVALIGGYSGLMRGTFGRRGASLPWRRRAFQIAALTSLTIAMVHALFDFNFYIPANAATLAAIVGAAVAPRKAR
jgi:O-antigen ligase